MISTMFSLIKNENLLKTHHSLSKNGDGDCKERLAVATTSEISYYFGQGYFNFIGEKSDSFEKYA